MDRDLAQARAAGAAAEHNVERAERLAAARDEQARQAADAQRAAERRAEAAERAAERAEDRAEASERRAEQARADTATVRDRAIGSLRQTVDPLLASGMPLVLLGDFNTVDREVGYGELNARANRLAHRLIELGVGPDTLVGICVERSPLMIVALLGVKSSESAAAVGVAVAW